MVNLDILLASNLPLRTATLRRLQRGACDTRSAEQKSQPVKQLVWYPENTYRDQLWKRALSEQEICRSRGVQKAMALGIQPVVR